jgi:hypothetical protein
MFPARRMSMELIRALLNNLFGGTNAGGKTMAVVVHLESATHCSFVKRYSTCGGDETSVKFTPPLPLEEALLHAAKYTAKGSYEHQTKY